MALFLSLLTAAFYGTADFCGGLAAQRARLLHVVAGAQALGLVGVLIASLLVADEFTARDFLLGAAGGGFGALAIPLLYRRLAIGPMQVVAPLTAVTSAATPAIWGVASGDDLGPPAWLGCLLAFGAIVLVSLSRDAGHAPVTPVVILESLAAGVGFGLFFILLDATAAATAPWPVAGARLATVGAMIPLVLLAGRPPVPYGIGVLGLIAATGVLDTGANVAFLYASEEGLLTLVAVVSSLYPVATVILARVILTERMTRAQVWGFLLAMAATGLIAVG